jgi:hypothetical protein
MSSSNLERLTARLNAVNWNWLLRSDKYVRVGYIEAQYWIAPFAFEMSSRQYGDAVDQREAKGFHSLKDLRAWITDRERSRSTDGQ